MKAIAFALACVLAAPSLAHGQSEPNQSQIASDFMREGKHISDDCGSFKSLVDCAITLVSDYPIHAAVGSLAPLNGFGFGAAFVEHKTTTNWRMNFSVDAVTSTSQTWRAGGYATFAHTKVKKPGVSTGPVTESPANVIREYPVYRLYLQHTVLNHLVNFGPDPDFPIESVFGEDQTVAGGSAVMPINAAALRAIGLSLIGGMQGRFITIHEVPDSASFFELFEDVRLKPSLFGDHLRLNYAARAQQFLGEPGFTFNRWTLDLRHDVPLYRSAASTGPAAPNGPNECFTGTGKDAVCPKISYSRNLSGSIGVRLLAISSSPFDEHGEVPFFLQPTIGGADIDNQKILPSFDDYRFRGPHAIAVQASFEHSIWGPFGGYLTAERGKAVQQQSELDFSDLFSSYSAGLSLRAGGAPMITASYGWGSGGNRVIVNVNSSLLGGSGRPSLQ